jgi:DNA-binding transcriptional LysR family regulator
MEQSSYAQRALPDWEGARMFLEIVRRRSFRAAADAMHISVNVLRRRFGMFEQRLGMILLTRHTDGIRLTNEGDLVLPAAERMEAASFDFIRAWGQASQLTGEVRLAITEGLGTFWIAPRLVEFQRAHPSLLIDIRCAMRPADVLRLETDIAVQLIRPEAKELRMVKIGRLHAMPFASRSYLETYGCPKSIDELKQHRIVLQTSDQISTDENFGRLFPNLQQVGVVTVRSNVSSAHLWAIAHGAGIGMLPTYAHAITGNLVPLDLPCIVAQDIWLTYHADGNKIQRVRRLIDWTIDAFAPRTFPWFRDEFVHPRELPAVIKGLATTAWFEGMKASDDQIDADKT